MLVATPATTLVLLTLVSAAAHAAVVTYNWNITYVNSNPDGLMDRRVIGINGQFPPPAMNVTLNDTLVINVVNQISEPTTLHAHGLFQTGNSQMDGPSMVTQCPIPPGANFTYTIPIEQYGTYWIHGHNKGHYVDGLRAPLIIHNPAETYHYDEEYTLAFVDWYHEEHAVLLDDYLSIFNPTGAEPVPKSALINQMLNTQFLFVPNKVYRLRIINMSALAMFHIHIDGHDMDIIEVDGVDVQRTTVKTFPISAAQRYSVLVTAKNTTANNFLIHGDMDPEMFDTVPDTLQMNITGTIIYDAGSPLAPTELIDWGDFDDAALLTPVVPMATTPADNQISLTASFQVMDDHINKASFNDITYVAPKVPTLYSALSMGNLSSDPQIYGTYTHPLVLKHNSWVEIIINNNDAGNHPFHLHGHVFQVVGRGNGVYDGSTPYTYFNTTNPLRRDTVLVPSLTNVAIRFQANNPGVWFFHCHIEWHLQAGLATTIIEAPEAMSGVLTVDQTHLQHCTDLGLPFSGNAAGNQGFDLTGQNVGPNLLPGTFTTKGIIALFFTVLSAVVGLATVIWYAQDEELVPSKEGKDGKE